MRTRTLILLAFICACFLPSRAGNEIRLSVRFDRPLQVWDGFGVNYVETAQTRDYAKDPQEYSGFSTLSEEKRGEILEMIFGPDGLKPGVAKMFLDPFHEGATEADKGKFDHGSTTRWMRYFIREGLKRTRADGRELSIITTLYGPPAWATKQKFLRGRDLDPAQKEAVAAYIIAWTKYLRDEEQFPVNYVGLHNEGEDFARWPTDGSWAGYPKHDYNMYWPPQQVVDFLRFMRPMMDRAGIAAVGLAPGETSSWDRFSLWGYAWSMQNDPEAMRNIGLITSHGFGGAAQNTAIGVDLLRLKRPELHDWTTSTSWGKMDAAFLENIRQNIYSVKVNALIPWAAVQTDTWVGGDPNPGTAFRVDRKGGYTVEPGYYYYKQVSRIGQPGMHVAEVESSDPDLKLIAFAGAGAKNPDGFAVFNTGSRGKDVFVAVEGAHSTSWEAFETSKRTRYERIPVHRMTDGSFAFTVPPDGVITVVGGR